MKCRKPLPSPAAPFDYLRFDSGGIAGSGTF